MKDSEVQEIIKKHDMDKIWVDDWTWTEDDPREAIWKYKDKEWNPFIPYYDFQLGRSRYYAFGWDKTLGKLDVENFISSKKKSLKISEEVVHTLITEARWDRFRGDMVDGAYVGSTYKTGCYVIFDSSDSKKTKRFKTFDEAESHVRALADQAKNQGFYVQLLITKPNEKQSDFLESLY